jgi:hypothetical protein
VLADEATGSARSATQNQRVRQPRNDCLNGVKVSRNRPHRGTSTCTCSLADCVPQGGSDLIASTM